MLTVRRILFPTDGSACSERAFAHAVGMALRHGAELHVLHVRLPAHDRDAFDVGLEPEAVLRARARTLAGADVPVVRAEECAAVPALGILEYAQVHAADLIVMGTHGRTGMERLLLGSVAEEIVRLADCPVLTVRPDADRAPGDVHRVLAPVDFSPASWLAVAYAEHLAALYGAHLDLLHVVETLPSYGLVDIPAAFPPPSSEVEAATRTALLDLAREAGGPAVEVAPHVVAGHPTIGVLETAKALQPDLIVLPTHGRSGVKRVVLGSVAEQIVRRAACPVLVVRGQGRGLLPAEVSFGDGAAHPAPPLA
jgi:nucleotide-binding universal stress UspA family protein